MLLFFMYYILLYQTPNLIHKKEQEEQNVYLPKAIAASSLFMQK